MALNFVHKCKICGSKKLKEKFSAVPDIFSESEIKYSYSTCEECDTLILNPQPIEAEIMNYYKINIIAS